ncbi:MAG: hypothetical protein PGN15_01630 [Aeromicrobium erythreum]
MTTDDAEPSSTRLQWWAVSSCAVTLLVQALFSSTPVLGAIGRLLSAAALLVWCGALITFPRRLRAGRINVRLSPIQRMLHLEPVRHSWALPAAGVVASAALAVHDRAASTAAVAVGFAAIAAVAPLTRRPVREALLAAGAVPDDPTSATERHRRRRARWLTISTWAVALGMVLLALDSDSDPVGPAAGAGLSLAGLGLLGLTIAFFMTIRGPDPEPLWYRESRRPGRG